MLMRAVQDEFMSWIWKNICREEINFGLIISTHSRNIKLKNNVHLYVIGIITMIVKCTNKLYISLLCAFLCLFYLFNKEYIYTKI